MLAGKDLMDTQLYFFDLLVEDHDIAAAKDQLLVKQV